MLKVQSVTLDSVENVAFLNGLTGIVRVLLPICLERPTGMAYLAAFPCQEMETKLAREPRGFKQTAQKC